jgi:hypothetical protein
MKRCLSLRTSTAHYSMLLLIVFLFFNTHVYGQKVYANSQTNLATGLCTLCTIYNPNAPTDSSSLEDYSTLSINAGQQGVSVQQTLIFPSPGNAGCDSLIVGIGSANTVLSPDIFSGVIVQTFNGTMANNDAQNLTAANIRMTAGDTQAQLLLKPAQQFDRVQFTVNSSSLGLHCDFRLYYACRQFAAAASRPDIPVLLADTVTICAGDSAVLNAIAPVGVTFRWYYDSIGGTHVVTGARIVLYNQPLTATFYVDAVDSNGYVSNARKPVTVVVNLKPAMPTVEKDTIIVGAAGILIPPVILKATGPFGDGVGFRWYQDAVGGSLLSSDKAYTIYPPKDTTYYVAAVVNGLCESPRRPVRVIFGNFPAFIGILVYRVHWTGTKYPLTNPNGTYYVTGERHTSVTFIPENGGVFQLDNFMDTTVELRSTDSNLLLGRHTLTKENIRNSACILTLGVDD